MRAQSHRIRTGPTCLFRTAQFETAAASKRRGCEPLVHDEEFLVDATAIEAVLMACA